MKATDLMLGDWVATKTPMGVQNSIIQELYPKGIITETGGAFLFDEISAVPLTPEILEKNGFKFDGSGQCSMRFLSEPCFSEGQRFNIYVGFKHKTIDVFVAHPIEKSPNWRKTNKAYLEVCGPYVHELQHALRLCGIDKEIVI